MRADSVARAFTLIEVLITLAILSTGIVLVLRAFETSLVALDEARSSMMAGLLLRNKISELQLEGREKGTLAYGYWRGRCKDPYDDFDWQTHVESVDGLQNVPGNESRGTNTLNLATVTIKRRDTGRLYSAATYIRTP